MSETFNHITARGNARQTLFVDDADRRTFLETLELTLTRHGWICHAYCLMTNHYHLLIEAPEPSLGAGMLLLNGTYARYFNRRHALVGHVFQGPYRAEPIAHEGHLLETCRYIALNPVRAGLVTRPYDWPWSSYRATAALAQQPPCLSVDLVRRLFGGSGGFAAFCNQVA
jgi:REP element-mobilizing transposase RayT